MLSIISILGIFTEIFCSGILVAGAITFLVKFIKNKEIKDFLLSTILLFFSLQTILSLISQIAVNLGTPISNLIVLHKAIAICFIIGAFLVSSLILNKLEVKKPVYLILIPWAILLGVFIFRVSFSQVSLIFRKDILEPLVNFSLPAPTRSIWALMWLLLGICMLAKGLISKQGKRVLSFYLAVSSWLLVLAYFCIMLYTATGQGIYLLISWLITLAGIAGITIAEIIPPEDPLAFSPMNFFRTRLLFKLISIFVLLIVILFEVTTLATLTISKEALSRSILNTYYEIARGIGEKISSTPPISRGKLFELVAGEKVGRSGMIYLIDSRGKIIAHPDPARIGENISQLYPAKQLLEQKAGKAEFTDELGYSMVGAYFPIFTKQGGGVIVQEPIDDAYFEMRQLETNSILFMILGIIVTIITGMAFAESIEKPVHNLIVGTQAISAGNLNVKIKSDSLDEIGSLAQSFNKMAQNLKDSQERLVLSEKLAALGTMAAGMAHEIKNPLVALRTFSQLLPQKWMDPEYREKFSTIVPLEIERINKIAESLLKFGRPTKAEIKKINVNNLIEEILMLNESECKKNGVRLTTKFAQVPEVTGDSSQLSQALLNIILNAIQSMENGGELTVKTDMGQVIKLGRMGKGVQNSLGEVVWGEEEEKAAPVPVVFVEISDTGNGIEAENLKSLFDPFFTTKDKGTGMGLPITLRIIEEHKGSIKVRSQKGKGTTFLITLPQNREETA